MRTTFDLSPLYRTAIGFERMSRLLDAASRVDDSALSYPPYNIEQLGQDSYRVTMAVAGFGPGDIDVTVHDGTLTVKGAAGNGDDTRTFLHRGIAGRGFERSFQLADHVEVTAAHLENGVLGIDLERRVPEELKPRRIEIGTGRLERIDGKAA